MTLKSLAALLVLLMTPTWCSLPSKHSDDNSSEKAPYGWTYFQVAPVGWNYVSSKGGVDTFFRSEGKPA